MFVNLGSKAVSGATSWDPECYATLRYATYEEAARFRAAEGNLAQTEHHFK